MYFMEMNRSRLNTAILSTTAFAISLVRLARLITSNLTFSNVSSLLEDASSNEKLILVFIPMEVRLVSIIVLFQIVILFCLFYLYKQFKKRRRKKIDK